MVIIMTSVFLKLLNMSISATWLVIATIIVRLVLKKAPKSVAVAIWALVAVRLLCPFSIESELSLLPSGETVPTDIIYTSTPEIHTGIDIVNSAVNPIIAESFSTDNYSVGNSASPMQTLISAASAVWVVGAALMLVYAAVSYIRIHRRVREAVFTENGIGLSDRIETPFIFGIVRPRIYIPSDLSASDIEYVIAHERAHLKRFDHIWKPLGFLLLSVYWFNPAVWVAYILLCRDIELACDEKVIKSMGTEIKKPYSEALINCSVSRRTLAACPLAFGEVGVKKRIKSVLNYKKPAFWVIIAAAVACALLTVCFLTDPVTEIDVQLNAVIREQISEQYKSQRPESEQYAQCYDYKLLGKKKKGDETTVYMWVLYEEYSDPDTIEQSAHTPTAITVRKEEGRYIPVEYWTPGDGSKYAEDIKSKFPLRLQSKAFDNLRYISEQHENCKRKAEKFFKFMSGIESAAKDEIPTAAGDKLLREKYSEYFDIDTEKGLAVYVWQLSENSYYFGLLPDKDSEYISIEDLVDLKGTTLAEMRAILATYDIPRTQITYHPINHPISSYFFEPNEEYVPMIEKMIWEGYSGYEANNFNSLVTGMSFDIDGDGIKEDCTVNYGPTSGICTYTVSAWQDGVLEYSNVFVLEAYNLRFVKEDDGRVTLHGKTIGDEEKIIDIGVEGVNISLTSEGRKVFYWG